MDGNTLELVHGISIPKGWRAELKRDKNNAIIGVEVISSSEERHEFRLVSSLNALIDAVADFFANLRG